jgi:hypothetical protein
VGPLFFEEEEETAKRTKGTKKKIDGAKQGFVFFVVNS